MRMALVALLGWIFGAVVVADTITTSDGGEVNGTVSYVRGTFIIEGTFNGKSKQVTVARGEVKEIVFNDRTDNTKVPPWINNMPEPAIPIVEREKLSRTRDSVMGIQAEGSLTSAAGACEAGRGRGSMGLALEGTDRLWKTAGDDGTSGTLECIVGRKVLFSGRLYTKKEDAFKVRVR